MRVDRPSDLPDLPAGSLVAVDTETGHLNPGGSGLWADSGARLSVVSVAWIDPGIVQADDPQLLRHAVKTGEGVHSRAFPFAQGIYCNAAGGLKPGQQEPLLGLEPNVNLPEEEWQYLLVWLSRHHLTFHHAKFDLEKLRFAPLGWPGQGVDFLDRTVWCSLVASTVLWPDELAGLKPTGTRLWGVESDSEAEADALKPYLGPRTDPAYDLVPWHVMGPYAAKDTELAIRLVYHQWAVLGRWWGERDERLDAQVRRELGVMRSLYRMERAGIPYDREVSMRTGATLAAMQSTLEAKIPFRPTDEQAKRYLFSDRPVPRARGGGHVQGLGLMPYQVTDTGRPSLTAEVVARLVSDFDEDHPAGALARVWTTRAKLNTAVSMWYVPYAQAVGPDGRLRTCFRQVARGDGATEGGTVSGRFSVERVNLQAIPHDYRLSAKDWGVPTPRQLIGSAAAGIEGWNLWEFDLAQAELRVAAAWARCSGMLSAIREGRDLHSETTMSLWPDQHPGDASWGFYRQLGKRANFTLCFGARGETFGKMVSKETGVRLSAAEADTIVAKWNRLYPQFGRAIARWSDHVERHRSVPLASTRGFATGRLRRFRRFEETHKAFNQLVQGSLAEFLKDWLLAAQAVCDREGLGFVPGFGWTGMLLTIHDSLVVLLPVEREEQIAAQIVGAAESLWGQYFNRQLKMVDPIGGTAEGKRWG